MNNFNFVNIFLYQGQEDESQRVATKIRAIMAINIMKKEKEKEEQKQKELEEMERKEQKEEEKKLKDAEKKEKDTTKKKKKVHLISNENGGCINIPDSINHSQ